MGEYLQWRHFGLETNIAVLLTCWEELMWVLLLRGILSFQNPPKDMLLEDEGLRGRGLKQKWVFACHSEHVLRDKCDVNYKVSTTSPETVIWIGEQVLHSCKWSRFTMVFPCLSTGWGTELAPDSSVVWKKCFLITCQGMLGPGSTGMLGSGSTDMTTNVCLHRHVSQSHGTMQRTNHTTHGWNALRWSGTLFQDKAARVWLFYLVSRSYFNN